MRTINTSPTPRWERRFRQFMDAAAMAFADKSYAGASMRDIAHMLGVRQASLYYYFASKEAALAAVCETGVTSFIDQLRLIVASQETAQAKILAAMENHLSPLRRRPDGDYIRVFLHHRHELPAQQRKRVAQLARAYQSLIEKLFADGIASGELRADLDAGRAALAFLGLSNSVITMRNAPTRQQLDTIIADYASILSHGVAASPAKRSPSRRRRSTGAEVGGHRR